MKSTKGAVGYVDLSDAKASGLKYATVKNQAGKFVEPTAEGASAAGEGIEVKDNLVFSALNAKGDKGLPDHLQTWSSSTPSRPTRPSARPSSRTSTTSSATGRSS